MTGYILVWKGNAIEKENVYCTKFTFQTGRRYCQATRWAPEEGRGKKLADPLGHSPDLSSAQASAPTPVPFPALLQSWETATWFLMEPSAHLEVGWGHLSNCSITWLPSPCAHWIPGVAVSAPDATTGLGTLPRVGTNTTN